MIPGTSLAFGSFSAISYASLTLMKRSYLAHTPVGMTDRDAHSGRAPEIVHDEGQDLAGRIHRNRDFGAGKAVSARPGPRQRKKNEKPVDTARGVLYIQLEE